MAVHATYIFYVIMERKNKKILIVDDEDTLREGLQEYLALDGFDVDTAASAEDALKKGVGNYDLILLDVMMDGIGGFGLAEKLRENPDTDSIPIIFLTAKDSEEDMVAGLILGADDYISKPFSIKNVIARIEAVLRRTRRQGKDNGVACDRRSLECTVDGKLVKMPRKEFEILSLLLDNPGKIFTREELLRIIWPDNVIVTDRSVDVHITRIRTKIAPYGGHLISRSGYGYGWKD